MAHNLHLMVIRATSGKEACNMVENEIIDFGDDNNWRSIVGAVSENNEIHIEEGGSWMEGMETIEKINTEIRKSISFSDDENNHSSGRDLMNALISGEKKKEDLDKFDWYNIMEFANDMSSRFEYGGRDVSKDFDILKGDQYKFGHYDEFGVTQHMSSTEDASEEGSKIWVVFVDMHS